MPGSSNNTPLYIAALGFFALSKLAYSRAGTEDLAFLLAPTNKLLSTISAQSYTRTLEGAYFYEQAGILVDKSCSGFNFFLIAALLFVFLTLAYVFTQKGKVLGIVASILGAYFLTIFTNCSRIIAAIFVQDLGFMPDNKALVHEAVGIITYLTFLILTYMLVERSLRKTN
jgi:exosortase K